MTLLNYWEAITQLSTQMIVIEYRDRFCIRIEFENGENGSGNTIKIALFCNDSAQALPVAKFIPVLSEDWYYDSDAGMEVLRLVWR